MRSWSAWKKPFEPWRSGDELVCKPRDPGQRLAKNAGGLLRWWLLSTQVSSELDLGIQRVAFEQVLYPGACGCCGRLLELELDKRWLSSVGP